MPFINELIPEDKYDFVDNAGFLEIHGYKYQLSPRKGSEWTIDHDRNCFLIDTGGAGGPSFGSPREISFGLWMDGNVVNFRAEKHVSRDTDGQHLNWTNLQIFTTEAQRKNLGEIRRMITEALNAMGLAYRRNSVQSVTVEFKEGG